MSAFIRTVLWTLFAWCVIAFAVIWAAEEVVFLAGA